VGTSLSSIKTLGYVATRQWHLLFYIRPYLCTSLRKLSTGHWERDISPRTLRSWTLDQCDYKVQKNLHTLYSLESFTRTS
jgi:hypothetical protein